MKYLLSLMLVFMLVNCGGEAKYSLEEIGVPELSVDGNFTIIDVNLTKPADEDENETVVVLGLEPIHKKIGGSMGVKQWQLTEQNNIYRTNASTR